MLRGEVTARKMAIVSLRLRSTDLAEIEIKTILDTGFTDELALPEETIQSLGWPWQETTNVMFGDGSIHRMNVYEGQVWWNYEWKYVLVQATTGMPLLGMSLLYDHLVTLEVVDGGDVTIEALE